MEGFNGTTSISDSSIGPKAVPRELLASGPPGAVAKEAALTKQLKAGDEAAFVSLLERLYPSMLAFARSILSNHETAEEVVQDAWVAALGGLEHFEGRSSLKTWLFSIVFNKARTRLRRERRQVNLSSLVKDGEEIGHTIERIAASDTRRAWMLPERWNHSPEEELLASECLDAIENALRRMPQRQAEVVRLRDIQGWSAEEVCETLGLSASNQKVLLHRGRQRIRLALERYEAKQAA